MAIAFSGLVCFGTSLEKTGTFKVLWLCLARALADASMLLVAWHTGKQGSVRARSDLAELY